MSDARRWTAAVCVSGVLLFACLSAAAQEGGGIYKTDSYFIEAPVPEGDEEPPAVEDGDKEVWQVDFKKSLLPGNWSRAWRSLSFSFSLLDQPDNIFVGVSQENPSGFISNPDRRLWKGDLTLTPGQWFWKPADFSAAYALGKSSATAGLIDFSSDPLAQNQHIATQLDRRSVSKIKFLAWAGKGSNGKRFASAISVTLANSERSQLIGTDVVPREIHDRDDQATTFNIKFDPRPLIRFPGEVSAAYTALEAHTTLSRKNRSGLNPLNQCGVGKDSLNAVRCLRILSDIKVRGRWRAAALPTIEFKSTDQFDFISVAGNFIGSQFLEESLHTITFTWDLGAALDSAKHRREALKAIALHHELVKRDQVRGDELNLVARPPDSLKEGELLYMPLFARYKQSSALPQGSWKARYKQSSALPQGSYKAEGVHQLNLKLSGDGILSGYPPAGEWDLVFEFKDSYGNVAETGTTLEVGLRPRPTLDQGL